jgi:acyl-coenzyme A thioesterase PaaI-like protein
VIERTEVQASFERLAGMSCFACAPHRLNASGLNLVFAPNDEGAWTEFRLPRHFESYPGFLHGGILSAVLDETMAYAGVFRLHALPFTTSLALSFIGGVRAEELVRCEARIESSARRRFSASGAILDERGKICVRAKADFLIPTLAMARKMLSKFDIDAFRDFFR